MFRLTMRLLLPILLLAGGIAAYAAWPDPRPNAGAAPVEKPAGVESAVPAGAESAVVERVVDGDTIWVSAGPALPRRKIRLLEIDAPELNPPDGPAESGARESTVFAQRELPVGSVVVLLADKEDTDRYGRELRYLWDAKGELYNEKAVRSGHARAVLYPPNDLYIVRLKAAEAEARRAGRGIWSCGAKLGLER